MEKAYKEKLRAMDGRHQGRARQGAPPRPGRLSPGMKMPSEQRLGQMSPVKA